MLKCNLKDKDSIFFVCDKKDQAEKFSGIVRQKLGSDLNLIEKNSFKFCWIVDFPMYHYDEQKKKIDFSHNPFSMPQINFNDFDSIDPLKIKAYQYDLVCNGYELSSGAIRNHLPNYMFKVLKKLDIQSQMLKKSLVGCSKLYLMEPRLTEGWRQA